MQRLWLRLRAPFAAFRPLQAGSYRASAPAPTPSAVWGLVLNLAGIETRCTGDGAVTQTRPDAPPLRIAIGLLSFPGKTTLYQQLHNYPVGNTAAELAPLTMGAKYAISPVRRELLVDLDAVVGVESIDADLLRRVVRGLRGELNDSRYGLPFAGDNNLLFDRIEELAEPPAAHWMEALPPTAQPRQRVSRLTVEIDRADTSRTRAPLYGPTEGCEPLPREEAWSWVPAAPSP